MFDKKIKVSLLKIKNKIKTQFANFSLKKKEKELRQMV